MTTAKKIRDALAAVAVLRAQTASQPGLGEAVVAVKRLQARRFAGTYSDVLGHSATTTRSTASAYPGYAPAARFFLTELYSDQDYSERDAQFSRIASPIEKLFPDNVGLLALALAELHALSEELDHAMGAAWLAAAPAPGADLAGQAQAYTQAWRSVDRWADRDAQLRIVLGIGEDLGRLTRKVGLRGLLRLMRGPAYAAGLRALQSFLESGFDTFAALAEAPGGVAGFLRLIQQRESALLTLLFDADAVACETQLALSLGQAP